MMAKKPTTTTHTATKVHMQKGDKAPNTYSYNSYSKTDIVRVTDIPQNYQRNV
jgi:hypothetical protein